MIVLDASVAVKAYLEEAGSDEATAVLACDQKLLAPELIGVEVCAAICRRVRRGSWRQPKRVSAASTGSGGCRRDCSR